MRWKKRLNSRPLNICVRVYIILAPLKTAVWCFILWFFFQMDRSGAHGSCISENIWEILNNPRQKQSIITLHTVKCCLLHLLKLWPRFSGTSHCNKMCKILQITSLWVSASTFPEGAGLHNNTKTPLTHLFYLNPNSCELSSFSQRFRQWIA